MSASTAALSGIPFRKLNIDQYDEDLIHPSSLYTPDPRPSSQILQDSQSKDRKVRGLLQSSNVGEALKECLKEGEWPYGEDTDQNVKQAKVSVFEKETEWGEKPPKRMETDLSVRV